MNKILTTSINEIPTSKEFQDICAHNSFNNLQDILNIKVEDLEYKYGFSKRMLIELMEIVTEYGLEEMVKEGDW